jgi:phytoene dehydrogenase-like protein
VTGRRGGGAHRLTAAATLGRAGWRALLLECDEEVGGQSRLVEFAPPRITCANGAVWDTPRRDARADTVTRTIAGVAPGFPKRVHHRVAWSPGGRATRRRSTGSTWGGAGTHPGPGILGGSGWLAARTVLAGGRRRQGKA